MEYFIYIILDGPRGSLRRLRSQLAEDGCPESQVVLAKQLLEGRCGNSAKFSFILSNIVLVTCHFICHNINRVFRSRR